MHPSMTTSSRDKVNSTPQLDMIDNPQLENQNDEITDLGKTNISNKEMNSLIGNYRRLSPKETMPNKAIILKLIRIKKKDGYRLCVQIPTKTLERRGLITPNWIKHVNPQLNIREVVMKIAAAHSYMRQEEGKYEIKLLSIDLTNAYARIKLNNTNLYCKTKENGLWHLEQPIQGLAGAGIIAPAIIHKYFVRILRKIRKKLKKKDKKYRLEIASYSDNAIILTNAPEGTVRQLIEEKMGDLFNKSRYQTTPNAQDKYIRVLGLRWKIKDGTLLIRRPAREKKINRKIYHDHIFGRGNAMLYVNNDSPLQIYCDGKAQQIKDHKGKFSEAVSAAGLYQNERLISARIEKRNNIDQILSEAKSWQISHKIREVTGNRSMEIKTDSEILTKINNNGRPRMTLEAKIIKNYKGFTFIEGTRNLADELTRNMELIDKYFKRRPQKERYQQEVEDSESREQIISPQEEGEKSESKELNQIPQGRQSKTIHKKKRNNLLSQSR